MDKIDSQDCGRGCRRHEAVSKTPNVRPDLHFNFELVGDLADLQYENHDPLGAAFHKHCLRQRLV